MRKIAFILAVLIILGLVVGLYPTYVEKPVKDGTGPMAIFENMTDGLDVDVDGSRSYDMSGTGIVEYSWEWGDGDNSTGIRTDHHYAKGGTYEIRLRVKNGIGMIGWASGQVTASEPKGKGPSVILILVPIALIAAGAGAYFLWAKRRKDRPEIPQ